MVFRGGSNRRSHHFNRHQRQEYSRHRHHQPARDDHSMGCRDFGAGVQRHCMAGPPHFRVLRQSQGRGADRYDTREDGTHHRRLFQRHENTLDTGERAGSKGEGRGRQAALRNRGQLADLDAHQGRDACDRRQQCLPHNAFQHTRAVLGQGTARTLRHTGIHAA